MRTRLRRFLARSLNSARRLRRGLLGTPVVPFVQNDLFQAESSLYDFVAGVALAKRVLVVHAGTGYGPHLIASRGAANVVAVESRRSNHRYATSHFAAANLEFRDGLPADAPEPFDVIFAPSISGDRELNEITAFATRALSPRGRLILCVPPGSAVETHEFLSGRFASVRTLSQTTSAALDFGSPFTSNVRGDDFVFREVGAPREIGSAVLATVFVAAPSVAEVRLHLGSGPVALPGWINIDNLPYPGVDHVWDLRRGLPYRDARFIYAEHFVEHLAYDDAVSLLRECRRVLHPEGVIRLSTPNLDWVVLNSYHPGQWERPADAARDCMWLNRAFRGWGHQFLYNSAMLEGLLSESGFGQVRFEAYGHSEHPELSGLEHHESYPDTPEVPHVLVVEASGFSGGVAPYDEYLKEYRRDVAVS